MDLTEFHVKYRYDRLSKVMQQYLDVKFAHLDCLILFRMGDFYELFFDDAELASQILGITLTKRGKAGEEDIAMCGVPHHALEGYLHKLLENGQKIAICDQLETPEEAKKRGGYKAVIERGVTRIITAGTIIEESLIHSSIPHYLASIVVLKDKASICYIDLSTSFFAVTELPVSEIINELARLAPKEILLSEKLRNTEISNLISSNILQKITYQVDSFFSFNKTLKIILDFYNLLDVRAIGEISDIQISSCGSII